MSADQPKPALLIVEDDEVALRQLGWVFDDYAVAKACDRASALAQLCQTRFAVVLLDLGLPPDPEGASEGLAALSEILTRTPEAKVIVVTGREERQFALKAIELGAYDFYRKPIDGDEIRFLVERASQLHALDARASARHPGGERVDGTRV